MAIPLSQLALYKEGRLQIAAQAYKTGQFLNYTTAAKAYNVNRSTLQNRIAGMPVQQRSTLKNRLLMPTKEESFL